MFLGNGNPKGNLQVEAMTPPRIVVNATELFPSHLPSLDYNYGLTGRGLSVMPGNSNMILQGFGQEF